MVLIVEQPEVASVTSVESRTPSLTSTLGHCGMRGTATIRRERILRAAEDIDKEDFRSLAVARSAN